MSLPGAVRCRLALRIAGTALMLSALLALTSCWVTSINALYENDLPGKDPDLVFDQNLVGAWNETGEKCTAPLMITAKKEVYYLDSTGKGEGCVESD